MKTPSPVARVSWNCPPLTDEKLVSYRAVIDAQPPGPVRDALETLYRCVAEWWEIEECTGAAAVQPYPNYRIIELDDAVKKRLFDLIPWDYELKAISEMFERELPSEKSLLRTAAFHLAWYAKELCSDREPLSNDKDLRRS